MQQPRRPARTRARAAHPLPHCSPPPLPPPHPPCPYTHPVRGVASSSPWRQRAPHVGSIAAAPHRGGATGLAAPAPGGAQAVPARGVRAPVVAAPLQPAAPERRARQQQRDAGPAGPAVAAHHVAALARDGGRAHRGLQRAVAVGGAGRGGLALALALCAQQRLLRRLVALGGLAWGTGAVQAKVRGVEGVGGGGCAQCVPAPPLVEGCSSSSSSSGSSPLTVHFQRGGWGQEGQRVRPWRRQLCQAQGHSILRARAARTVAGTACV